MGKAAGVWKKIKQVGKTIGKGLGKAAVWVNDNLYKPGKDLLNPVFDMIDGTGTLHRVADGVSRIIDYGAEKLGYSPDDSFAPLTETVTDVVLDTQRTGKDKKYKDPFETAIHINEKINDAVTDYNAYRRVKNGPTRQYNYGEASANAYDDYEDDEDWSDYSDSEYYLDDNQQTVADMIKRRRGQKY